MENNEKYQNGQEDESKKNDHKEHEHPGRRIIHPRPTHGEPAVRARLHDSALEMQQAFPALVFSEEKLRGRVCGVWTGIVRPINTTTLVPALLDDLAHDRPVQMVDGGIEHLQECTAVHDDPRWEELQQKIRQEFAIRVVYEGDISIPRCYVVDPEILAAQRVHMWADGSICAFLASERVWLWHSHTVVDYMPHALIWLAKWSCFAQTGVWIGAQHHSNPQYHLAVVGGNDPCWCGSGIAYRKCCQKQDLLNAGRALNNQRMRNAQLPSRRFWDERTGR